MRKKRKFRVNLNQVINVYTLKKEKQNIMDVVKWQNELSDVPMIESSWLGEFVGKSRKAQNFIYLFYWRKP